ncbi:MAG: YdeI/OmpD-associated family protein [Ginsengibacter sp.]
MKSFSAKISKIGINPYVPLPLLVLNKLFIESGKNKGPIPVQGTLNGKKFLQTLVKYSGEWRLYLNTPMRKAAGIDVGDMPSVTIKFDPGPYSIPIHPKLTNSLTQNKRAAAAFKKLTAYRRKEIVRYLNFLKTEQSVDRNVEKIILHLSCKEPLQKNITPYKDKNYP